MSRARTIKPDFWDDPRITSLPRDARLLFIATWTLADDEGLLPWSAALFKDAAFAYDDDLTCEGVQHLMDALVAAGLVLAYSTPQRGALAFIVSFRRHQSINRPTPSKITPPPLDTPGLAAVYAHRDGWHCRTCGDRLSDDEHPGLALSVEGSGAPHPSRVHAVHCACRSSEPGASFSAHARPPADAPGGTTGVDLTPGSRPHLLENDMGIYDTPVDPFALPRTVPVNTRTSLPAPAPASTTTGGEAAALATDTSTEPAAAGQDALALPALAQPAQPAQPRAVKAKRARKPRTGGQLTIEDPVVEHLCEHLAAAVRHNLALYVGEGYAARVKVTPQWREAAEKLLRLDGFTVEQVLALIDWVSDEPFWREQIRSMPKLRDKVDSLAMDRRFLTWAAQHSRPTRAGVGGTPSSAPSARRPPKVDFHIPDDAYEAKF